MNEEYIDQTTGEVITAADGNPRHPAVTCLTDLIKMLNDGAFDQMTRESVGQFSAKLEELGNDSGRKVKGSITLKMEVEREADGHFFVKPKLEFKLPSENFGRTIAWVTEDGRLTPTKPNQHQLFGHIREVSTPTRTRTV